MNISTIKDAIIFQGMEEIEIEEALKKLSAIRKRYSKGSNIFHAGDTTDKMGLVLKGSVSIENIDVWGNRTILSHVGVNQFFAETYGILKSKPLLVDVTANEDCEIMFLKVGELRSVNANKMEWEMKLLTNLLMLFAQKNLSLSGRSFHTSPKTIRERVMSYLNSIAIEKANKEFCIPFDRQQMADYLNVERTALSKELRKMKDDELIDFHKNHFILREIISM